MTPPKLTVLPVPTFLLAKATVLLLAVSTSPANRPVTAIRPVAAVVASYTLLSAVAVNTGVPDAGDEPFDAITKGVMTRSAFWLVTV